VAYDEMTSLAMAHTSYAAHAPANRSGLGPWLDRSRKSSTARAEEGSRRLARLFMRSIGAAPRLLHRSLMYCEPPAITFIAVNGTFVRYCRPIEGNVDYLAWDPNGNSCSGREVYRLVSMGTGVHNEVGIQLERRGRGAISYHAVDACY
jgi:hypothetical protein